ncbi:hypothetical protein [Streptomyces parvulus]|uniref:hypothetical protein n=1 Tax=Streptomyces parvulus TaxID=146923 RepID=UPI0033B4FF6B
MSAPSSGGPGSGWFGSGPGDRGPRRPGAAGGNGETEILGSRIAREHPGSDPFGRPPRITWGKPDAAAPAAAPPGPPGPAAPAAAPVPAPPVPLLRDPWQETPEEEAKAEAPDAAHTHDPHEVTVQLDAVQLGDGVLHRTDGGHRKSRHEPSEGPVFVDASGRRSRLYRRLGILVGIACAVYAVVIVSTLMSGNSDAPWMPVPGQEEGAPAGQVDTTPLPSRSGPPAGTGTPEAGPSAAGSTGTPGAGAPAPGTTSGDTPRTGTSTGPGAGETGTDEKPAGTGSTAPGPTGSSQAPPPSTTGPSAPAGGGDPTTVDPTEPTGGATTGSDPGEGGAGVNGAATPLAGAAGTTVAAERGDTSPSTPLSPETTL